jgi:DNA segregation ATPase FtsK/SpoIIIE-like protein
VRRLPTGLLANAPNRVCFRVTSVANSLQALGRGGAEKLKRPGDFLFVGPACDDGEARGRTVEITSEQVHQAVQRAAEQFGDHAHPRKRSPPESLRSLACTATSPARFTSLPSPTARAPSIVKRLRALIAGAGMAVVAAARACWPVVRLLGALVATLFAAGEWVLAGAAYWFRRQARNLNRKARPPRQRAGRKRRRK